MRRWLAILVFLAFVVAVSSALARSDANSGFTVTSSLDGKTVLPVRSHWIASPKITAKVGSPSIWRFHGTGLAWPMAVPFRTKQSPNTGSNIASLRAHGPGGG